MSRSTFLPKPLLLCFALSVACSQGGNQNNNNNNNNNPEVDMSVPDGGIPPGSDLGGGGKHDMATGVGIPCTPGSYRCGSGNAVEICNSSGTAWLYSATCTVSCMGGLCTGACEPGTKRCNGKNVEVCNMTGSAYAVSETCSTFCEDARCAIASLDVGTNKSLDGDQLVDGDIVIRSGATLTSPMGDLTLRTRGAIMVETGASIVVNPTGASGSGVGSGGGSYYMAGGGGGYGTVGSRGYYNGGPAWGSDSDAVVQPGSPGGYGAGGSVLGGSGGGVLRLIAAKSITIAGQVTANGATGATGQSGGGGGSGGGILIATPDKILVSGSLTANGGAGGTGTSYGTGGAGGMGRIKVLNSGARTVSGTITGTQTLGLIPPLQLASSSHPNQTLVYNDAFPSLSMSWNQAFSGLQGYYYKVSQSGSEPPTPANGGKVVMTESINIAASDLHTDDNYFHIVPIDAMSNVGTVENTFHIVINSTPPTVSSSSHPSPSSWYASGDVYFEWDMVNEDKNSKGIYYVLDHYGDTMPTSMGTFIPVTQKKLLRAGLANGVWVMHMVPIDQHDYLTKTADHFRVKVGPDPGNGTILGQVVDSMGKPVPNARVTVNRGLWTMTTNSMGSYNFMSMIPANFMWEIKATSADGLLTDVRMDKVDKDGMTTVNLTLK